MTGSTRGVSAFSAALASRPARCAGGSRRRAGLPGLPALVALVALVADPDEHPSARIAAIGALSGASDLSGLTGTLENGLPANVLGGLGSGLAWAGGSTFLATPDRGPNATLYNTLVDDTTSYIARFQTLSLGLTATPNGALPYTLSPTLTGTTLLFSSGALTYGTGTALGLPNGAPALNGQGVNYFTGRSDNFNSARLSTERTRPVPWQVGHLCVEDSTTPKRMR